METNYRRGARFEYKTMQKLRDRGCDLVFRAAGSHGVIDVVGIDTKQRIMFLIQCKSGKSAQSQRGKLEKQLIPLTSTYLCGFGIHLEGEDIYVPAPKEKKDKTKKILDDKGKPIAEIINP